MQIHAQKKNTKKKKPSRVGKAWNLPSKQRTSLIVTRSTAVVTVDSEESYGIELQCALFQEVRRKKRRVDIPHLDAPHPESASTERMVIRPNQNVSEKMPNPSKNLDLAAIKPLRLKALET